MAVKDRRWRLHCQTANTPPAVTVRWRAEALADVVRLVRYISEENPIAARWIGQELLLAGDSLAVFPKRGRRGTDLTTRELVTIQPYIIVYQLDEADNATILSIWHSAQDRP